MPLQRGRRRSRTSLGRVDTVVSGVQTTPSPSRCSCVQNTETPSGSGAPLGGLVSRLQGGPNSLAVNGQVAVPGGGQLKVPTPRAGHFLCRAFPPRSRAWRIL